KRRTDRWAKLQLLNRRYLDEEALAARRVELDLGDALSPVVGHRADAALAKVVVTHAVAHRELEVAVVAHRARDLVGPLGLLTRLGLAGGAGERRRTGSAREAVARTAPAVEAARRGAGAAEPARASTDRIPSRVECARLRAPATVGHAG